MGIIIETTSQNFSEEDTYGVCNNLACTKSSVNASCCCHHKVTELVPSGPYDRLMWPQERPLFPQLWNKRVGPQQIFPTWITQAWNCCLGSQCHFSTLSLWSVIPGCGQESNLEESGDSEHHDPALQSRPPDTSVLNFGWQKEKGKARGFQYPPGPKFSEPSSGVTTVTNTNYWRSSLEKKGGGARHLCARAIAWPLHLSRSSLGCAALPSNSPRGLLWVVHWSAYFGFLLGLSSWEFLKLRHTAPSPYVQTCLRVFPFIPSIFAQVLLEMLGTQTVPWPTQLQTWDHSFQSPSHSVPGYSSQRTPAEHNALVHCQQTKFNILQGVKLKEKDPKSSRISVHLNESF